MKNAKYLKTHSILINISRGGVINEEVLYMLLKKQNFSAATDVYMRKDKTNYLSLKI